MSRKSRDLWTSRVEADEASILLGATVDDCPYYRQLLRRQLFDQFKRVVCSGASSWFYNDAFSQYLRQHMKSLVGTSFAHMTQRDIFARSRDTRFEVTPREHECMQRYFGRALRIFSTFHGLSPLAFQSMLPRQSTIHANPPDITIHSDHGVIDIDFRSTWLWRSITNRWFFFRDQLVLGVGKYGVNYTVITLNKDLTRSAKYVSMHAAPGLLTRFPWYTAEQKRKGCGDHDPQRMGNSEGDS